MADFTATRVERIEQAIPTVTYPRVIKRIGKAPPQYSENERKPRLCAAEQPRRLGFLPR